MLQAFTDASDNLDEAKFKDAIEKISLNVSLQQQLVSGAQPQQVNRKFSEFLSGAVCWKQLEKYEAFSLNPAVRANIDKALEGRDLRQISADKRAKILIQATTVPPEILAALENTASGY